MFKKQRLGLFFIFAFNVIATHAILEKQSAIFYECDIEIIRDAHALQEIFNLIMEQLNQTGSGSISINYTDAGYTLLQALQKGGYLNLSVDNKENKAYLDWLIKQKSTVQKKSLAAIFKEIKKTLKASDHTNL